MVSMAVGVSVSEQGDITVQYRQYAEAVLDKKLTIPTLPQSDGTYSLKVTISDGEATYSWV